MKAATEACTERATAPDRRQRRRTEKAAGTGTGGFPEQRRRRRRGETAGQDWPRRPTGRPTPARRASLRQKGLSDRLPGPSPAGRKMGDQKEMDRAGFPACRARTEDAQTSEESEISPDRLTRPYGRRRGRSRGSGCRLPRPCRRRGRRRFCHGRSRSSGETGRGPA